MARKGRGGAKQRPQEPLEAFDELNQDRAGLTLRHRGSGQRNRDRSLSNKAGKLQNGHLERPNRKVKRVKG